MFAKIALLLLVGCAMVMAVPIDILAVQNNQQIAGQIADRASDAFVTTYDQKQQSLDKSLNNVNELVQKTGESAVNILKSGLEIIFFIPNLGRNFFNNKKQ